MVSVQCYMFVCRLVISVQGVIIIDLSSLGYIVPEILKGIKKPQKKTANTNLNPQRQGKGEKSSFFHF